MSMGQGGRRRGRTQPARRRRHGHACVRGEGEPRPRRRGPEAQQVALPSFPCPWPVLTPRAPPSPSLPQETACVAVAVSPRKPLLAEALRTSVGREGRWSRISSGISRASSSPFPSPPSTPPCRRPRPWASTNGCDSGQRSTLFYPFRWGGANRPYENTVGVGDISIHCNWAQPSV